MSLTLADVEQALALPAIDFQGQERANEIISEWMSCDETILMQMTEILSHNDDPVVRFKVACGMRGKLELIWGHTPDEQKVLIRQELVNQIQRMIDNETVISTLAECVGTIAVFDLPDQWEEFYGFCFVQEGYTLPQVLSCLVILAEFAEKVDTSKLISYKHRVLIRNQILENTQVYIESCMVGFKDPNSNPIALRCLNYILKWSQEAEIITEELVHKLLSDDLCNEKAQKPALDCLKTIFVDRNDGFLYFRKLSPFVIIAIATGKDPTNPNLPLTNSENVINFLITFMFQFTDILRVLSISDETLEKEPILTEVSILRQESLASIESAGINLQQFMEMVVTMFHVILSVSVAPPEFWDLWRSIFREISSPSLMTSAMPITDIFAPMMPMIRENVFRLLETAADDADGSLPSSARSCFSLLIQINQEESIAFLNEQEPSISLCYAISSIELCFKPDAIYEGVAGLITRIIEEVGQETPEEVLCAVMYMCSHISVFIESDSGVFETIITFLLQNLAGGTSKVASAAALALINIIKYETDFLSTNCETLAGQVIQASEDFINNLDPTNMKILFLCCSILSKTISNEEQYNETVTTLFQPVVQTLENFFTNPDENIEKAVLACDIIQTCAVQYFGRIQPFINMTMEALMAIAPNIINNVAYAEVSDYLFTAIAQDLTIMPSDAFMDPFRQLIDALPETREATDSVFRFISIVRHAHSEVDELFPEFMEKFIQPALTLDPQPLEAICIMVKQFTFQVVPFDFLVELVKNSIDVLDRNTNVEGMEAWRSVTGIVDAKDQQPIIEALVNVIIPVTFQSIVTTLHSSCYDQLARFMTEQLKYLLRSDQIEAIKEQLVATFNQIAEEPEEGLYDQFLSFCFAESTPKYKVTTAVGNLLTSLRKTSPVDKDAFKIARPRNNIFSMFMPFLLNDVFTDNDSHVITLSTVPGNSIMLPGVFSIQTKDATKQPEQEEAKGE